MSRRLGIVVPDPYQLETTRGLPLAPWPRGFEMTAPPEGPFYELSPLEKPQPLNAFNMAILAEWNEWRRANEQGLPGSGKPPAGSGNGSGSGSGNGSGYGDGDGSGGSGSANGGAGNSIFTAYANNPIAEMPDTGQPLHYTGSIPTPAPGTSDELVLAFYVPDGWIAVIKGLFNDYANNSFQEGSGELIWRVDIDGLYPPGFDAIKTRLGSIAQPRPIAGAIIALSGQRVRYTVSVDALATIPTGASVYTHCGFDGYLVPAL